MSKEAVLKVKDAENEAQRILQEAAAKSKAMVDNAEKKLDQECEAYELEMSKEYSRRVGQVRLDADDLAEESRQEALSQADVVEKEAKKNMNDAVRIVMRRIISECQ